MKIEPFYPQHPVLKNYIEYYYFQKTDSDDFYAEYYAFPNTLQALNIHKNIRCEIDAECVRVSGVSSNNYAMILQGRFQSPLHVQLKGKIDKVTIIFKALGLNHFITSSFKDVAGLPTQVFTEWLGDETCLSFVDSFYKEEKLETRIAILEQYLLTKFKPCSDAALLFPALELLIDFDEQCSIEEIAGKLKLNSRTFHRLFLKHLGVTPVAFRKIARFRHALKHKVSGEFCTTLTKIGYDSNFYDQSHFNREYKTITGQTPSQFFKSIDKMADSRLIFRFVK